MDRQVHRVYLQKLCKWYMLHSEDQVIKMMFKRVRNYKTKYQVFVGKKSKTVTTKTSTPQEILSLLTAVSEDFDQDEKLVNLASSSKAQSEDLSTQQTVNQKVYSSAKTNRLDNWTQLRQAFLETAVEMECPNTQQCCLYGTEDTDLYTCYRCIDCSSWLHMCLECLRNKHSLPHLHMFEKWMNGTYVSYKEDSPVWKTTHVCSTSYCKKMVILDERGRQHLRQVQLCSCEPEAVSLLRMDLWAASPKQPRMAFQFELLKWLNDLLLHCYVSVSSFVDALNARISKRHSPFMGQCSGVYQVLMKE